MFKKFYKRIIFYFLKKFKTKFEIVSYENFLNLIKYYEDNLPDSIYLRLVNYLLMKKDIKFYLNKLEQNQLKHFS